MRAALRLVAGGFDLSVGSLMTLTVMGSALLINNDPALTWCGDRRDLRHRPRRRARQWPGRDLPEGAVDHRHAGRAALSQGRRAWPGPAARRRAICRTISAQFGRLTWRDVPVIDVLPLAVIVLVAVVAICAWLLHGTNFGRLALSSATMRAPRNWPASPFGCAHRRLPAVGADGRYGRHPARRLRGRPARCRRRLRASGYRRHRARRRAIVGRPRLGPGAVAGALTLTALFTVFNLHRPAEAAARAVQGGPDRGRRL